MKYFNPSYWFKLWVLSAPLFNDKIQGINAKSIDNKKIKDWVSNNTSLESINEYSNLTNSSNNYQPYNLNQISNQNINPFYQTKLETSTHKHRHEKSRIRNKRQLQNNENKSRIIYTIPNDHNLIISNENPNLFVSSFESIIFELAENDILRAVYRNPDNPNSFNQQIFTLNDLRYGYFRISVQLRWEQNGQSYSRNLGLIFRVDNLYLEGFLFNSNYYHFNFELQSSRYRNQYGRGNYQRIEHLTSIENYNSIRLEHIAPDYRDMIPEQGEHIYWSNIFASFFQLTNNIDIQTELPLGNLARSLRDVILVTSESLRFRNIFNIVNNILINRDDGGFIDLNMNPNENNWYSEDSYGITGGRNNIYRILVNWASLSQPTDNANRVDRNVRWLLENYRDWETNIGVANMFSYVINERYNRVRTEDQIFNQVSLEEITWALQSSPIRILLGGIILRRIHGNCNNRIIRQIKNNDYWNEEFCKFKPEINKIKGEVKLTKIIDNYNKGNDLNIGDIYIGTTNGLYLLHRSTKIVYKEDNINDEEVTSIKNFAKDKFYATTKNGDLYFLRTDRIATDGNLIGEILSNIKSSDLNKELKIYYDDNKKNHLLNFEPSNSVIRRGKIYNLNLGRINPIDNYKKLEFLGDTNNNRLRWGSSQSNCWDFTSDYKLNYCYYQTVTGKNLKIYLQDRKNEFHDIIKDGKISTDTSSNEICRQYSPEILDDIDESYGSARVFGSHSFGLRSYYEWNRNQINYYIQAAFCVYADWRASSSSLESWFFLGNGIRLYNDDNKVEVQISNPNDRKKRNVVSNTSKWKDDFTKSINNEQHLAIDNKTNFVTNNITSL